MPRALILFGLLLIFPLATQAIERRKEQFLTEPSYLLIPFPYSLPGIGEGIEFTGLAGKVAEANFDAFVLLVTGDADLYNNKPAGAIMTDKPRGVHDLGGLPAGPIDKTVHESSLFEKRVDALMILMSHPDRRVITVDELRRGIESFPPEEYVELAYYERWVFVLKKLMMEKNILSEEEISERVEVVRKRLDAGGEL